jgi:hypothetical protein
VHERQAPVAANYLRAENDVAELARKPLGQLTEPIDRKGENIGDFIDCKVLALESADLFRAYKGEPELPRGDPLAFEQRARKRKRGFFLDALAASVVDLDLDHLDPGQLTTPLGARRLDVTLVGLDDALHELVANDVLVTELDESDAFDVGQDLLHLDQAGGLLFG